MPINKMLAALEQEGKENCQKILSDARIQAKKIIKETEETRLELENELLNQVNKKLEKERSRVLKEAQLSVSKVINEQKEKIIEKLFKKLLVVLEEKIGNSPQYSSQIFEKLANEALDIVKIGNDKIILSVNKKDADTTKRLVEKIGVEYQVENNLNTIGGLIVRTADGRINVDNTLESRANKANQLLKPEIINVLFGESK